MHSRRLHVFSPTEAPDLNETSDGKTHRRKIPWDYYKKNMENLVAKSFASIVGWGDIDVVSRMKDVKLSDAHIIGLRLCTPHRAFLCGSRTVTV